MNKFFSFWIERIVNFLWPFFTLLEFNILTIADNITVIHLLINTLMHSRSMYTHIHLCMLVKHTYLSIFMYIYTHTYNTKGLGKRSVNLNSLSESNVVRNVFFFNILTPTFYRLLQTRRLSLSFCETNFSL